MAKKGSILHRMFAAFAKDAEPEEVREAARAVDEAEGGGEETPQEKRGKDIAALMDAVEALNAKVDAFTKSQAQDDDPDEKPGDEVEETEALDDLEEELEEGGDKPAKTEDDESEEESVTVPPEQLEEDEDPEDVPADEKKPVAAADRALALSVIRTMRPFIAAMPPRQQRRASDALSRTLKKAMRTRDTQPLPGGYGVLSRRKTADAATREKEMRAYGENCRKRNPHCKKEEK